MQNLSSIHRLHHHLFENPSKNKQHLEEMLNTLANAGVTLKMKKCTFLSDKVEYLEHIIQPGKHLSLWSPYGSNWTRKAGYNPNLNTFITWFMQRLQKLHTRLYRTCNTVQSSPLRRSTLIIHYGWRTTTVVQHVDWQDMSTTGTRSTKI